MKRAREKVNEWADLAYERRLGSHAAQFWTIRDILEGKLAVDPGRAAIAVQFIREKCKESEDRAHLLAILEGMGYK